MISQGREEKRREERVKATYLFHRVFLRSLDFTFCGTVSAELTAVEADVGSAIFPLVFMPEAKHVAELVGNRRVPVFRWVLLLRRQTKMCAMTTGFVTPCLGYVTGHRRGLDVGVFGGCDYSDIIRDIFAPDPGIIFLFALVVAVLPSVFLELELELLEDERVLTLLASLADRVCPELPGGFDIVCKVGTGGWIFETVLYEAVGPGGTWFACL
jgi:hypothetical protein